MRWITPLLAALLIIGILPADDSDATWGSSYKVTVTFCPEWPDSHGSMSYEVYQGDALPPSAYLPTIPDNMIWYNLRTGEYFDRSAPIYYSANIIPHYDPNYIPPTPPTPHQNDNPELQPIPMAALAVVILALVAVAYYRLRD